jgi:type IV pilus assembly protein PilA
MKQCPRCHKNLVDSAVACTFCRQPLPPMPATAFATKASPFGARPTSPRPLRPASSSPSRGVSRARPALTCAVSPLDEGAEPPSLNPFVLFGRCFCVSGSFSRGQFAIVYLGSIAAFWGLGFMVPFTLALLGAGEPVALRGTSFVMMAMLPVVLVAALGGSIRRWHDLGKSAWHALLWIVPCVNGLTVLYLLLARGEEERGGRTRAIPGWLLAAVVFVVGVFGVGLAAAIAIPSLLRARVAANEAAAIGDVRALLSAEAAYQRVNAGYFEGRLDCLARPAMGCLPGYPAGGAAFLESALAASGPRYGYQARLEPGPPAIAAARSSPTSVLSFAYVLVPVQPGQTGIRSFCGDSSGLVCYRPDGADIAAEGGACPRTADACTPLR